MKAKSRQQAAYDRLRADILNGVLRPGERLRFNEICRRYDVSVGAIREALSRLAEQGLVTVMHQSGFAVMSLSPEDLEDLTFARCSIEAMAIKHAISRQDVTWEAQVLAAHHRLASCKSDETSEEWSKLHYEFHEALVLGCGSKRLSAVATQLRASAEVYRRWSLAFSGDPERDIAGEHEAIVEAVLERDESRAASLIAAHISRTTQGLLSSQGIDWEVSS